MKDRQIPVVVVESHHHVLEHIHYVLRRQRKTRRDVAENGWSMFHFDAHPDLACPTFPAAACFRPHDTWPSSCPATENSDTTEKNLYELLDSTASGIAEWILPLVLGANLRRVQWFPSLHHQQQSAKNSSADMTTTTTRLEQIPCGDYQYLVGAWIPPCKMSPNNDVVHSFADLPETARVRVNWDTSYYTDDGVEEEDGQSSLATDEKLHLSQALHLTVSDVPPPPPAIRDNFSIDVCLDFFACRNPFLQDVEDIYPGVARSLVEVVKRSYCYRQSSHKRTLSMTTHFRDALNDWIDTCLKTRAMYSDFTTKFASDYLHDGIDQMNELCQALSGVKEDQKAVLGVRIRAALPHITLPHFESFAVAQQMRVLKDFLSCSVAKEACPLIVSVARSAEDGFTPASLVENLQSDVLALTHARFCSCPRTRWEPEHNTVQCRLNVLFDYGSWEGSSWER